MILGCLRRLSGKRLKTALLTFHHEVLQYHTEREFSTTPASSSLKTFLSPFNLGVHVLVDDAR